MIIIILVLNVDFRRKITARLFHRRFSVRFGLGLASASKEKRQLYVLFVRVILKIKIRLEESCSKIKEKMFFTEFIHKFQ